MLKQSLQTRSELTRACICVGVARRATGSSCGTSNSTDIATKVGVCQDILVQDVCCLTAGGRQPIPLLCRFMDMAVDFLSNCGAARKLAQRAGCHRIGQLPPGLQGDGHVLRLPAAASAAAAAADLLSEAPCCLPEKRRAGLCACLLKLTALPERCPAQQAAWQGSLLAWTETG